MDADDDDAGTRGAAPLKCGYNIRRIYKKAQIIENFQKQCFTSLKGVF